MFFSLVSSIAEQKSINEVKVKVKVKVRIMANGPKKIFLPQASVTGLT